MCENTAPVGCAWFLLLVKRGKNNGFFQLHLSITPNFSTHSKICLSTHPMDAMEF